MKFLKYLVLAAFVAAPAALQADAKSTVTKVAKGVVKAAPVALKVVGSVAEAVAPLLLL